MSNTPSFGVGKGLMPPRGHYLRRNHEELKNVHIKPITLGTKKGSQTISHMDSDLYRAAISGNINFLRENETKVRDQVAQSEGSVLHLASLFSQTECVREILKMHPSLLCKVNSAGETALHLAAKCGHYHVVRELINESKKSHFPPLPPPPYYHNHDLDHRADFGLSLKEMMLRVPNVEKDTALHEAARYNRLDVVTLLVEEDPHDSHTPNKADESPLYLAAYRGFDSIVKVICETCASPAYHGSDGRTVLHASLITPNTAISGLFAYLLRWKEVLIKEIDKHGWTVLHFAAFFNNAHGARSFLQVDKSVAYLPDYIKNRTALHIAASSGAIGTMKEIIEFCPDCCTMVDKRAQNILHIAIERGKKKAIRYILQNCPVIVRLLSQKDDDGNTPLHLLAAFGCFVPEIIRHEMADKEALNNKDLTPMDTIYSADEVVADQSAVGAGLYIGDANRTWNLWRVIRGEKEQLVVKVDGRKKEIENEFREHFKRMSETHMIVAALIVTITFTAGFTLPGGFDGNPGANQGTAILSKKAAFQAFIIADLIALLFSTTSLVMYFLAATLASWREIAEFVLPCVFLNVVAIVAMMVAFITGTYVVLAHSSTIAITLCVIGCSFFLIVFFIFRKCYYIIYK